MMKNMNTTGNSIEDEDPQTLEPQLVAFLGKLASETAQPSSESDLVIRRAAAARMALVRKRKKFKRVVSAGLALAACWFIASIFVFQSEPPKAQTLDLARDDAAVILREVSTLFPGQVRAIHRDETGLHLTLAEKPDVTSTLAIVIEVGDGKGTQQIITFSGQTIEIDGQTVRVEADAKHGVLLNGQDQENWRQQYGARLRIRTLAI